MSFSTGLLFEPSLSWWRRFWLQSSANPDPEPGGWRQPPAESLALDENISLIKNNSIRSQWVDIDHVIRPCIKILVHLNETLLLETAILMTWCRREETGRFIFVHNITSLNCTFPLRPSWSTSPLSAWLERMQMPGRRKLCWQCEVEPVFSVVCNSMWNVIIHSPSYTQ